MAFNAEHHADLKYQRQVLNEIRCISGLMKAEITPWVMHGVISYLTLTHA